MKRKTLIKIIVFFSLGISAVLAFRFLSPLFHQEVPQNTIRILIERPMDEQHPRLEPLLAEKKYTYHQHGEDFDLIPTDLARPKLQFHLVRDENTRALIFLKGGADVLYNSLSIAKTEWLRLKENLKFTKIYSNSGEQISYLALNELSPLLQNSDVKLAIELALPRKLWVETVFINWVELLEPENTENRKQALSNLHLPKNITLNYLTTSSREGQQIAFLTREALKKVGINVEVKVYESALFYAKIRKREFDLYSARSSPSTKNILDLEGTVKIPLFKWKHGLILNSRIRTPNNIENSLDYSFRFLSELTLH